MLASYRHKNTTVGLSNCESPCGNRDSPVSGLWLSLGELPEASVPYASLFRGSINRYFDDNGSDAMQEASSGDLPSMKHQCLQENREGWT